MLVPHKLGTIWKGNKQTFKWNKIHFQEELLQQRNYLPSTNFLTFCVMFSILHLCLRWSSLHWVLHIFCFQNYPDPELLKILNPASKSFFPFFCDVMRAEVHFSLSLAVFSVCCSKNNLTAPECTPCLRCFGLLGGSGGSGGAVGGVNVANSAFASLRSPVPCRRSVWLPAYRTPPQVGKLASGRLPASLRRRTEASSSPPPLPAVASLSFLLQKAQYPPAPHLPPIPQTSFPFNWVLPQRPTCGQQHIRSI